MAFGRPIGLRQAAWIEDAGLGAHRAQQPRSLFSQQAAVGALAHRAVQQQDARRVRRALGRQQPREVGPAEAVGIDVRELKAWQCVLPSRR